MRILFICILVVGVFSVPEHFPSTSSYAKYNLQLFRTTKNMDQAGWKQPDSREYVSGADTLKGDIIER
eukprot:scaffold1284_cov108-Cylindrotheca_fusiformis.AAC.1